MTTNATGERILVWRATARTWVRWRRLLARGEARRLYVHLVELGCSTTLCGRVVGSRVVERDLPKRLCPHCSRLSTK